MQRITLPYQKIAAQLQQASLLTPRPLKGHCQQTRTDVPTHREHNPSHTTAAVLSPPCLFFPIRRKEENMHKKSIGFNWGPCAVSTSHWTGVRMSTLLKMVGVQTETAGYVSFRGPKGELPKGDDGSYGRLQELLLRAS